MKQKYKTRNSPRRDNAIKQAYIRIAESVGWWGNPHFHDYVGNMIWPLKYKADKYDVLNGLVVPGTHRKIVSFARGDIRHRSNFFELMLFLTLLLALLLYVGVIADAG